MEKVNYSIAKNNDFKMKFVKENSKPNENRILTRSATKKSNFNALEEKKIKTAFTRTKSTKVEDKIEKTKGDDEINFSTDFSISIPDENSPLKLKFSNSVVHRNDLESNLEETKNVISVFDKSDYEELAELPDEFDYKDVHLKEDVFVGYEEQKASLNFLIKNSINRGESGTVLIYGGPGSGKTSFVNTVLEESEIAKNCRILELSGLIYGNDVGTIRHIAEFFEVKVNDLAHLMDELKVKFRHTFANVIIVLDKFEMFCDKNQFLLYCFFDLIQYVTNILIIGMTSRYDCIELLEKRVKSRMNHKIIDLRSPFHNLGEYLNFAKKLLDKDVPFTKQFQTNLEIQFSKSYSIAHLKTALFYNMRSTRPTEKIMRGPNERYLLKGRDEKVNLICYCLTNLEISILLLAAKLVYLKELEYFNCNFLLNLIKEIPSQIPCNQKLLYMAVSDLIEYGLFVKEEKKLLKKQKLYLTEWTPLVLNVFKSQIEESLKRLESKRKLPTGLAQLFSIQY